MKKQKSYRGSKPRPTLADKADRHRLYELAVQDPESETDFVARRFRRLRGRPARLLREDFCGTAGVCREWVARHRDNRAIGIDLDPEVLAWGRIHNLEPLPAGQRQRVRLKQGDVLRARTEQVDVVSAMNFSYWLFDDRATLKRYFKRVRRALVDDGVFFLDAFGGYDAMRELEEEREIEDGDHTFTYVWDQARFNPIDNGMLCHIHFDFPDGSRLEQAFSYQWRLWTLPEIRDLLEECGFSRVTVYTQGFDADGEPDGLFKPAKQADADAGWICYLTAEK